MEDALEKTFENKQKQNRERKEHMAFMQMFFPTLM